jgi:hypothetical protein
MILIREIEEPTGNATPVVRNQLVCPLGLGRGGYALLQSMKRADTFGFWKAIILSTVDEELRRLPLADKFGWVEPI